MPPNTCNNTVGGEIFARRKALPISPPALVGENFYAMNFFYYREDMVTFTTLAKVYSAIQRQLSLANFLSNENFQLYGNYY